MAVTTLATFLHVSDLHFQEDPPDPIASAALAVVRHLPYLDGLLGNDPLAVRALDDLWHSLRRENPRLIVTGDLTQWGGDAQLDHVARFLGGPPTRLDPCLEYRDWRDLCVPGNHDHWPGGIPFRGGPPPAWVSRLFPDDCFVRPPLVLPSGHRLVFAGLNSEAGLARYDARRRWWALGACERAVQDLAARLGPRPDGDIRILLVHHSPSYAGGQTLYIERPSLAALVRLIEGAQISVVLTGHIHDYLHPDLPAAHWPARESRCGTSTQKIYLAGRLRQLLYSTGLALTGRGGALHATIQPNTVLIHRVEEEDGKLFWRSETRMLNAQNRFAPVPRGPGYPPAGVRHPLS